MIYRVKCFIHLYLFTFTTATRHFVIWSDFRIKKVTGTGQWNTNAERRARGSTIHHINMISFLNTNAVSPPPDTIPQRQGASYDEPITVMLNMFIKIADKAAVSAEIS